MDYSIFIPQEASCAVDRTYDLIRGFADEGYEMRYITTSIEAQALLHELRNKPVRIVVFGHFWPTCTNLRTFSDQELEMDWNQFFSDTQCQFLYGHVCFGTLWLNATVCPQWISYSSNVKMFFGEEQSDENLRAFFKKQLDITFSYEDANQISEHLKNLYKETITHLKFDCQESASCQLLANLLMHNLNVLQTTTK